MQIKIVLLSTEECSSTWVLVAAFFTGYAKHKVCKNTDTKTQKNKTQIQVQWSVPHQIGQINPVTVKVQIHDPKSRNFSSLLEVCIAVLQNKFYYFPPSLTSESREDVIIECPLNDLFHDRFDLIITSWMAVSMSTSKLKSILTVAWSDFSKAFHYLL